MKKKNDRLSILLAAGLGLFCCTGLPGCQSKETKTETATNTTETTVNQDRTSTTTTAKSFGKLSDGTETQQYTLTNSKGMKAVFANYGGRLVSLLVPDKNGKLTDVVVGFSDAAAYEKSTEPYFGATIGRIGNRIAKGRFTLNGQEYKLFTNNGPNTLNGGKKGFQAVIWNAKQVNNQTLELT